MPPRHPSRDLRASDTDRERVVSLLAEAAGDGRLTPEEHEQRLQAAISARTLGELAGLTTDLVAAEAQPLRLDGGRPVLAVFGSHRREGRWVVPDRLSVTAVFGEAVLDFRDALLQSSRTTVYTTVIGGRLRLYVPEGVKVEVTGAGMAAAERGTAPRRVPSGPEPWRAPDPPRAAQTPVIEVRGLIVWGRIQAISPPRDRFLGIFPRRGR